MEASPQDRKASTQTGSCDPARRSEIPSNLPNTSLEDLKTVLTAVGGDSNDELQDTFVLLAKVRPPPPARLMCMFIGDEGAVEGVLIDALQLHHAH